MSQPDLVPHARPAAGEGAVRTDRHGFLASVRQVADSPWCVAVADIDRFRSIEKAYGRATAAEVTRLAVDSLAGTLQSGCVVAQVEPDEIGILCRGRGSAADAVALCDDVRSCAGATSGVPRRVRRREGCGPDGASSSVMPMSVNVSGAIDIDDFGTGHSSLDRLRALAFDSLKIDRSFVHGIDANARHRSIVASIVHLADALGAGVVAEGVETAAQRDILQELGCAKGQGYLFSQPAAFTHWDETPLAAG